MSIRQNQKDYTIFFTNTAPQIVHYAQQKYIVNLLQITFDDDFKNVI